MKLYTFIVLLLISILLKGQTQLDTSNILPKKILSIDFLNFGGSFPIGGFSKRTKKQPNSGFAGPGVKLDANINYQFYKNLGVKIMFAYQSNKIDNYKYRKDLALENTAYSYSISAGAWQNISALFGAYANFKLDENLHFQPKILLGFNYGLSPEINIIADSAKHITEIKQHKGKALAFCYVIGADFKLNLINNLHLLLGFDSFNTDLYFNAVKVSNKTLGTSREFKFKQPIQTLSFKIGLGKTFG